LKFRDFLLYSDNSLIDPLVGTLLVLQQYENRIDRGEIGSPECGGTESTKNGQTYPLAIGEGMSESTEKIFHDRLETWAPAGMPGSPSRCGFGL
jgi:hypothetical protein